MTDLMRDVASALAGAERPGDFYTSGTGELAAPGLVVQGVGRVALPLLPAQAAALVSVADKAPYGRGAATIVDQRVRRTWQIDPRNVEITGRHWVGCLDRIVAKAVEGLGVDEAVEAQFYKLLVYDEGSFFVGHRDTEKVPGMFATLVVVLPGDCSGGDLVVRHQGREARLDLRVDDPGDFAFAAFYADCVHEVLPVTAGHRLTLVYNLVRRGRGRPPQPPNYDAETTRLVELLRGWPAAEPPQPLTLRVPDPAFLVEDDEGLDEDAEDFWDDEDDELTAGSDVETFEHSSVVAAESTSGFEKLVYPLAHAYTQAELGFASLKGADAAAAGVLTAAAERADFEVHLALLVVEESGSAEYTENWGRSRRRSRSGDDNDDDEYEVGEIFDTTRTLSHWQRPDAAPSPLGPLPVMEEELSPPDAIELMEPDRSHFSEASGNEGASFERTYKRAALVIWPRARGFAVMSQAGLATTLPALETMVREKQAAAKDLAGHMIASWPRHPVSPHSPGATYPTVFLARLKELGDPDLVLRFLVEVVATGPCLRDNNPAVLDAVDSLPEQERVGLLERIVATRATEALATCADLLARAVVRPETRPHRLVEAAKALVAVLPGDPATARWGWPPSVEPGVVADLLRTLPAIDEDQAGRAVEHVLLWPKSYGFDDVLVPALRQLAADEATSGSPAVERLRAAVLAHLDARIAQPLAEPTDYRRDSTLSCSCVNCKAVAAFLDDPVRPSWSLRAVEHERGHVEETVRRAAADVDAKTDRKGRPYTLILTKTKASFERRSGQRARDLANRKVIAV